MTPSNQSSQQIYCDALCIHLTKPDEASLLRAYEFGRAALSGGLGVLDLVMLHHEALGRISAAGWPTVNQQSFMLAAEVLAEGLSPFEMAARGYREANELLERRVEERTCELTKAAKSRDEFLATVSHELKTPLTSIRAAIAFLGAGKAKDGALSNSVDKAFDLAHRNCERLTQIVSDLMDVASIRAGHLDLDLRLTELQPILNQACERQHIGAAAANVNVEFADRAKGVHVVADHFRIRQVLGILLSNAAKFSDEEARIDLTVDMHDEYVRVSVIDCGIGIPKNFRSHVFQPFTQADSSSTRQRGGAGLGLSIAKSIVVAHRGAIGFFSVEGKGATFYFDLPHSSETVPGPETAPGVFVPAVQTSPSTTACGRRGSAGQHVAALKAHNKEKPMTFQSGQSGQSGNPAGRPKGARGKATILAEGLFEGEAQETGN
jgi:signal transduction histidine kinase